MAARWDERERRAWAVFFEGRLLFPPGVRSLDAAIDRVKGSTARKEDDLMPWVGSVSTATMHAASMAALRALAHLPHRQANQLKDYVDAVVTFAVGDMSAFYNGSAEAEGRLRMLFSIPDADVHRAILATRAALQSSVAEGRGLAA